MGCHVSYSLRRTGFEGAPRSAVLPHSRHRFVPPHHAAPETVAPRWPRRGVQKRPFRLRRLFERANGCWMPKAWRWYPGQIWPRWPVGLPIRFPPILFRVRFPHPASPVRSVRHRSAARKVLFWTPYNKIGQRNISDIGSFSGGGNRRTATGLFHRLVVRDYLLCW